MTAPHPETHEVVAPGDLKVLAAVDGPCLTAVVPLTDPHIEIHIKNAIRGLQKKLAEQATDRKTVSSLLEPVFDLALRAKTEGIWAHALILFRSPGLFQYYLLHGQFKEAQTVDSRFHVRPLLRALAHETRFHVLGLSQRHVRLLHCTQHRAEPVATRAFPTNLQAWLNSRQPDPVLANRSSAGPSVGAMKGVVSSTSTDREREDEYLRTLAILRTLAPGISSTPVTPGRARLSRTAEAGYLYCGSHGAGHFVKMVHNGIEYGMMQSLAEGFDLLYHADTFGYELPLPDIAEVWRRGSVISSWLLDLTAQALALDPTLATVEGRVADSGEGRWTVESAVEAGVPCPAVTMALYTRFRSQASRSFAEKMLSAMRMAFGGHVESHEPQVR